MRKFITAIMLIIIVIVTCVACVPSKIIGKWEDENDTVEFKRNGKFTSSHYFMNGTYEVSGNQVTMDIMLLGKETYDFTVKDGILTMTATIDGVDYKYEFKKK